MRVATGLLTLLLLTTLHLGAQTPADSVALTFRAFLPSSPTVYVPGSFNNWGPNASGVISPGAPSQMTYSAGKGGWLKSYTFRIHSPGDPARTLGDSVLQYKFNQGGASTGWMSDPNNPEQNAADNNNSILRLTNLFWFEYKGTESGSNLNAFSAGLFHAGGDSITQVTFTTGATQASVLTTTDITSSYDPATGLLDYTLPSPVQKTNYIRLVGYGSGGDSAVFTRGGYAVYVRPLPAYAQQGVTLPTPSSNDSTTFRIRVSGKDVVLLRVFPLGQQPSSVTPVVMAKAPNPADWWINVKLTPGTYEYVYEIENGRQIFDPWGRVNGTYGTRFTIGPEGLTADNYVWNDAGFQRPPLKSLVIEEINIGEVVGGYYGRPAGQANFRDLIPLLGHYDSLGVNGLEFLPVNDYGSIGVSGFSWGYDLNSWLALEPGLGSPAEFKELVDSAHAHGIAVIIDAVFNHLNTTSALWQMQPDDAANPYFKPCGQTNTNEFNIACFFEDADHWAPETQEIVLAALRQWIDVYHADGFRYDFTIGIGWDRLQPTKGILGWANKIDTLYGGTIYQMTEHLPENPALAFYSGTTGGWHDGFHDKLFSEADGSPVALSDFETYIVGLGATGGGMDVPYKPFYSNRTEPVNMTVDHDEESLVYQMMQFHSVPQSTALQRDRLYGTFMFTSLGIPFLWEGVEWGEPRGWTNDGDRLSYRPVNWSLRGTSDGQADFAYYRTLALQRTHNPALTDGLLRTLWRYDAQRVLAWGFIDTASGARVMAVANMSASPQTVNALPWLGAGTWYDIFDQSQTTIVDTTVNGFLIPAYTARVFTNRTNAELGIVTSVPADAPGRRLPAEVRLLPAWPNPFNPSTTLAFDLPSRGEVRLEVFDMLGRLVATLADGVREAGRHTAVWNAANAATGIYVCRLTTPAGSAAQRLAVVR